MLINVVDDNALRRDIDVNELFEALFNLLTIQPYSIGLIIRIV